MLLTCYIEHPIISALHNDVIHCQGDRDRARGGRIYLGVVILEKTKHRRD